jgi:long-chain acyl-CoA synthetase
LLLAMMVMAVVVSDLARLFAWVKVEGREHLKTLTGPVLFVSNHQGYFDVPILFIAAGWRWRLRMAPVMRKEFFEGHFHGHSLTNSLNYYLASLFFNAFPIPQREPGALSTLRYMGELANKKWCVLIFPEGRMTRQGEIAPFQPGVGMIAGLDHVLHQSWKMARMGRVRVAFGAPLYLEGSDYLALARRVEEAVRKL